MSTVPSLWQIDAAGQVSLNPHRGQARIWACPARFVAMVAGSQSGKTVLGPWWLHREIYGGELRPGVPLEGRGAGDYLAVTSSYDLFKLKMLPEIQNVFCNVLECGRYWAGLGVMELKDPDPKRGFWAKSSMDAMWGRIILRSANAEGGLESATAKAAWIDEGGQEDFTSSTWEAILRRLSLAQGRALITTTPYNMGWLYERVYKPWLAGDPDYEVVQFASVENPAFPRQEFERAKRDMQDWKFSMFYLGQFTRPAGLIYADFGERHLCDPFEIPPTWKRWVGVDFGGVHTAFVWLAEDPATKMLYLYDESLEGNMTTQEHAKRAIGKITYVADERDRDKLKRMACQAFGGAASEEQERRDFGNAGFPIAKPPVSSVEAGIDRVASLLKKDRLRVFRTCHLTRDGFATYSREVDEAGNPTEKIRDKATFHTMDALRYVATGVGQSVGVRWL